VLHEGAVKDTRRRFLLKTACIGAVGMTARRLAAEEPFDALPASVWRNARTNGLVMIRHPAPTNLSWRTQIAADSEPGEPLIVGGQVFTPDGRTPAAGVTVYAYNTDVEGYYGENHKEYPPRIYGWMKTDADGRVELRTIRPGCYPGMRVPAHIHFELWGGGYPLQWTEELKFEGGRYITPDALARDAQLREFHTIQRLDREDEMWKCRFKIRLRRETNFT
jgi:protocatechuate 3,4-dioxygenase beta subunit